MGKPREHINTNLGKSTHKYSTLTIFLINMLLILETFTYLRWTNITKNFTIILLYILHINKAHFHLAIPLFFTFNRFSFKLNVGTFKFISLGTIVFSIFHCIPNWTGYFPAINHRLTLITFSSLQYFLVWENIEAVQ